MTVVGVSNLAISRGFSPRLLAMKRPAVPSAACPAAKMLRPAGWYGATSVRSRKLMSVRVKGWPAVRHSRRLSATAGAMSALPVGYDHDTRVLVARYPVGSACVPSNTVTELSNTRSPAGDHCIGPTLSSVSSDRHVVVPSLGLIVYKRVPTSKVTSGVAGAAANTQAPVGSPVVLVGATGGCSVVGGSVVAVVGGAVLLGVPRGARVSGVVEPPSTLSKNRSSASRRRSASSATTRSTPTRTRYCGTTSGTSTTTERVQPAQRRLPGRPGSRAS